MFHLKNNKNVYTLLKFRTFPIVNFQYGVRGSLNNSLPHKHSLKHLSNAHSFNYSLFLFFNINSQGSSPCQI